MDHESLPTDALPLSPDFGVSPAQRRAIAIVEVLLCSSVPTQLSIGKLMEIAGWSFGPALTLPAVVVLTLADTVVLVTMMVLLTRAHGESISALWLGSRRPWPEVVLGVLLIPTVFLLVGVLMTLLLRLAPVLHNVANNPLEELGHGGPQEAALLGVVALIGGGVREELQRAFLLQRFERHLGGAVVGVIVLSAAFGLGHLVQGRDAAITTGVLGAFWAIVYLRRRSTIAPMVSHAGFNGIEVLRLALESVIRP